MSYHGHELMNGESDEFSECDGNIYSSIPKIQHGYACVNDRLDKIIVFYIKEDAEKYLKYFTGSQIILADMYRDYDTYYEDARFPSLGDFMKKRKELNKKDIE